MYITRTRTTMSFEEIPFWHKRITTRQITITLQTVTDMTITYVSFMALLSEGLDGVLTLEYSIEDVIGI